MALDFVVRGLEAPDGETNRTPRHITLRGLTLRGLPRRFATDSGRVDALSRAEQRPAASQGGLICSDRKLGRPPTEVVRWLVPVAAVIGASWGRVVVVLSEIAALGEARSRDQRDKRESSDKCLHDTSPWFRTVVLQRGKPLPFAAAAWSRCTQENMCEIAPNNLDVPRRTFWDIRTIGNRIGQSELSN